MDVETAHGKFAWPHSGFHVHDGVWVAAEDREFAVRLARYCARNPVALTRLAYQSDDATVTYHSDKPTGPTRGGETLDVLEFLARVVSHIPNQGPSAPAPLIHRGSDRKQRVDHHIRFPGLPTHPTLLWEGRLKFLL